MMKRSEKKLVASVVVGSFVGTIVLVLLASLFGCVTDFERVQCRQTCWGRTPKSVTWYGCACNPETYGEPGDRCETDRDCRSRSCLFFIDGKPGRCQ